MHRRGRTGKLAKWGLLQVLLLAGTTSIFATARQSDSTEAGRRYYEGSDYKKAVEELQAAATREPSNGEIQLLLTKSFLELGEHNSAIASAEKAVAINPQSSMYHHWLGRAYGEKADHSSMFTALGLARKTRKEFETAVQLDEKNFAARQDLIEFDCSAPSLVGGGEDKARPEIAKLKEMDASEWHYAEGNCRRQKKDLTGADTEFELALKSSPKSADLIYDIGDYEVRRMYAEGLITVAELGAKVAPTDPRAKFFRAAGLVLKREKPEEAEKLLRQYLAEAPTRNGYPRFATAHEWLGKLYESRGDKDAAAKEYQAAVQLDSKDKNARDSLRRVRKN